MVIIVMKSLLVSWLLSLGGVEHAMDILKKVFQGNQVKLSVQIDSIISPLF